MNIAQIFNRTLKGKNFMTPYVEQYYERGKFAIELSSGTDFDRNIIYGVTVLEVITESQIEQRTDLGKCFSDEQEAIDYINKL